ncbi:MAG: hypothetical protein RL722_2211, partial [Pseudomonadota bacterium]
MPHAASPGGEVALPASPRPIPASVPAPVPAAIPPGLVILHGNRLEALRDAVAGWLARHPLAPLEEEVLLVQSIGAAEWLKMALAGAGGAGVCAATRVELPARFLWRSYRQMLGDLPSRSALDKDALTWRLMHLLPALGEQPEFAPVAGFLRDPADLDRRLQLAQRLADLFDQYQVYRADWLADWAEGRDLIGRPGAPAPLPSEQRWQPALWRAVLAGLDADERVATRPEVHRRFIAALRQGQAPQRPLPRRVVLFGAAQLPGQTLEALAALADRSQVLLAVPNPCRFHWADIIEGRELLAPARPRLRPRHNTALHQVDLAAMHLHAHPLLAAWGRQGRDFMRQLDAFDDAETARLRHAGADGSLPRLDLFDEAEDALLDANAPPPLLLQVQRAIRDLLPLHEHPRLPVAAADRSIVFHIAHSAQREVEVLHDQLLALLAASTAAGADHRGKALEPRDIVVMVPDIELFAPAIRAVFGQVGREDPRHIPFEIADLRQRGHNPLVLALEWLLRAPEQRFCLAELRALLDVPALARRFGLDAADLPRLAAWMEGAGLRWGLDGEQRAGLGLGACGEQNTALFGLRRLLLGYAAGAPGTAGGGAAFSGGQDGAPLAPIWPHDEVGGLEAGAVGALADLLEGLTHWWRQAQQPATPTQWVERGRALLEALFEPVDERERLTLAALRGALDDWLEACDSAAYAEEAVPVAVLREAWLQGLDAPGSGRRFLAGGVTFCTLMPLRAVPFEVVCLLGMNDGDYPRATRRSDFDLLGLPGQARPGDRSRRDDDRYLLLEALLSAGRVLYLSWAGRSPRDNSEQPPSVLLAQLRDYLGAGWCAAEDAAGTPASPNATERLLHQLTTEHPLQPFSRRYFEAPVQAPAAEATTALFTHAHEWRDAHQEAHQDTDQDAPVADTAAAAADDDSLPPFDTGDAPLTVMRLARFLRNPVQAFFRERLHVQFRDKGELPDDDEAFQIAGLEDWQLLDELIADPPAVLHQGLHLGLNHGPEAVLQARLARLQGSGRLPLGPLGPRTAQSLAQAARPLLAAWQEFHQQHPQSLPARALHLNHAGVTLSDWLDGLRGAAGATAPASALSITLGASRLLREVKKKFVPRPEKLVDAWVRLLAASACGQAAGQLLVGRDGMLALQPLPPEEAQTQLHTLMAAWAEGMQRPLPLACRTALAALEGDDAETAYEGADHAGALPGEVEEPCLA